jgi:alpha-L-rhamnosidase
MAAAAGEPEVAARYRALRTEIGAAFARAYIGADGRIAGPPNPWKTNASPGDPGEADGPGGDVETQTGYVVALHMNLVPADLRAAALARLVADIEARGVLTTGFTGVGYILPLLTANGHVDLAYRLLRSERFPSWGYMIRNGATTIWERWDGWTEEKGFQTPVMNSFNHYSLGSVGEWLYRSVAGIDLDPERPGFAHAIVRPRPGGGLTWARATYKGVRGEIASGWELDGETLTLRVTIPPGSVATIAVPTSDPEAVIEGDGPAASAPGLTLEGEEPGAAVFVARAGAYVFRAPYLI